MNIAEQGITGAFVVGTVITAAACGILAPLVGVSLIALGTRHVMRKQLSARWADVHQRERNQLVRGILQVRLNAERAREHYAVLKAATPKNAKPAQLALLQEAREAVFQLENNPLAADRMQLHLDNIQGSGEPEKLLRDINVSSDLIGWGTFFQPLIPLLLYIVYQRSKKEQLDPIQFEWYWDDVKQLPA